MSAPVLISIKSTFVATYICLLLTGFLLQYTFFCFLGFWCFHLFHLFLYLAFPYEAEQWTKSRKNRRIFHVTEVLIVLVCGLVPPIVTISVSNYQDYGVFCLPQSTSMTFYGQVIPNIVLLIIGLSLLFCSLWILRTVSSMLIDMLCFTVKLFSQNVSFHWFRKLMMHLLWKFNMTPKAKSFTQVTIYVHSLFLQALLCIHTSLSTVVLNSRDYYGFRKKRAWKTAL